MKGRKRGIDEWGRAVCLIWLESEVTSVRQKQTFWTNPSGRADEHTDGQQRVRCRIIVGGGTGQSTSRRRGTKQDGSGKSQD